MAGHTIKLITSYHGTKDWRKTSPIRAASINYLLSRGSSLTEARAHAKGLLKQLMDFSADRMVLSMAMYQAQAIGVSNPFISTTRERSVAASFALDAGSPGFCVTIEGPQHKFYDFNQVREKNKIPHRPEFRWLQELGIPLEVRPPFRIIRVDYIEKATERSKCVYQVKRKK